MKLVIIGGVAGGASAAVRARRLAENAEIIVVEKGPDVSYANCGLPYYIGGEIPQRSALELNPSAVLSRNFRLEIRTETEALSIDRAKKSLVLHNLKSGENYSESYDYLILAPGANPKIPFPGCGSCPRCFTIRSLTDIDKLSLALKSAPKSALVLGAGFIGLEMAENLSRRQLAVTVIEANNQVLACLDREMALLIEQELVKNAINLRLDTKVVNLIDDEKGVTCQLSDGTSITADLIIIAAGVSPDSQIATAADLKATPNGAIVVDQFMRTSDHSIYAVGDAVACNDPIHGDLTTVPLAGPANKQARIAVNHIFGRKDRYRGTQGTSIVRVFGKTAAATGWPERLLRQRGIEYQKIYVNRGDHVSYFPGATAMTIKLLFAPLTGKLLGCQIVGSAGVDKRIDVIATAMQAGLTAEDLSRLELAYAPQYGAAKDPVNIAGYVAANLLAGDENFMYAEQIGEDIQKDFVIIDLRTATQYNSDHIPGAINIPFEQLRLKLAELSRTKPILSYCNVGQRSYYANCILRANGFSCFNLAGGFLLYRLVHPAMVTAAGNQEPLAKGAACGKAPTGCSPNDPQITLHLNATQSTTEQLLLLSDLADQHGSGSAIKITAEKLDFEEHLKVWCTTKGFSLLGVQYNNNQLEAFIKKDC
jgi:NADPH-dependent 2,4-dienoyl-CoA reductase/sulfur reductase-like enzyme/rhodanese-related sulfurtransferase